MDPPKHTLFPFLHLTRELLSTREPPLSPKHGGLRLYPDKVDQQPVSCSNQYPAHIPISPISSLQLTCRQMNEEAQDAVLRSKRKGSLPFELDIMMLDEMELYPTWLSIPAVTECIPKLNVEFRLFGNVEGKKSACLGGDGAPPIMVWSLFTLMERFLLRGPDLLSPIKQTRKITDEELSIDLQTPLKPPKNGFCVIYNNRG